MEKNVSLDLKGNKKMSCIGKLNHAGTLLLEINYKREKQFSLKKKITITYYLKSKAKYPS